MYFYLVQKLPELSCVSFWLLDESTFSVSSSLAAYYMVIRWKAVVDPIKTFYKSFSYILKSHLESLFENINLNLS